MSLVKYMQGVVAPTGHPWMPGKDTALRRFSRGLAWFDGYQFAPPVTGKDGAVTGEIQSIVRKGNGDIAIHAGESIWTGRSGRLRKTAVLEPLGVMAPLGDDDLYVTKKKGHFRIHEDIWTRITPRGNLRATVFGY